MQPISQYENLRLENQLCFALYSATHAVTRAYRQSLDQLDLTYPQYLVMLVLWQGSATTVSGIAQQLNLDSGTLTPLLKRLERASLIVRQRSLEDERIVNISLTENGSDIRHKLAAIQRQMACRTGLSADDFEALRTTLRRLSDSMARTKAVRQLYRNRTTQRTQGRSTRFGVNSARPSRPKQPIATIDGGEP